MLLVVLPEGVQLLRCVDDEVCEGISCSSMTGRVTSGLCLFCLGWTATGQPILLQCLDGSGWATSGRPPPSLFTRRARDTGRRLVAGGATTGQFTPGRAMRLVLACPVWFSLAACGGRATSRCLASRGWVAPPVSESSQHLRFALVVPLRLVQHLNLLLEQCGLVGQVTLGEFAGNVLHRDVFKGFAYLQQVGQEGKVPHSDGAAWWCGLVLFLV